MADEILAVNNFEVDKHPRTLARHTDEDDDKDKIEGIINVKKKPVIDLIESLNQLKPRELSAFRSMQMMICN
jgi:hypothetical protein